MLKANTTENAVPSCFGKYFESTSAECVGGYDATYYEDGTHIRPKCDFVSSCSTRMQATRNVNIVPTTSLVRPATQFNQPAVPVPVAGYRPPTYAPITPPGVQHNVGVPQAMAVNYGIPQYLTVREPSNGRGLGKRLAIEAGRSILKSLGHTIAHFFDVETFGGPRQS